MPSRRDKIKMTEGELRDFLVEQRIMQVVTIGPGARPHLMPIWYLVDGLELRGWTYAKSQKAKNLERDPRATIGVDTGLAYDELRGVMMECDVELIRDEEQVGEIGRALFERYTGGELAPAVDEMVRAQAKKRLGLHFLPTRTVTWDHRKLGGVY